MPTDQRLSYRRQFLKSTGAVGATLLSGFPAVISAHTVTNAIKVGLVGCGGRGTGAASQALHADDYAELTAMADIDHPQFENCLATLNPISKSPSEARWIRHGASSVSTRIRKSSTAVSM